jgi:hypothetical protein
MTSPVLTWLLFAGVLMGTQFSPFYDYALQHPLVQEFVEYPLYLGVALLYYYPLLGANGCPRRVDPAVKVISLFLMMLPETMTGFFLYASDYDLYPFYAKAARSFGPGPIADQQIGGALMWAGGMIIDAGWLAWPPRAGSAASPSRAAGPTPRSRAKSPPRSTARAIRAPLRPVPPPRAPWPDPRAEQTRLRRCLRAGSAPRRSLSPRAGDDTGARARKHP